LNVLILVNDLLGRLDILDAQTLKNLDHFHIGHAARNFNLLPGEPGVGVIASSTGLWKVDLCAGCRRCANGADRRRRDAMIRPRKVLLLNPPGRRRYLRDCYCSSIDKAAITGTRSIWSPKAVG
jgi:hypothetical protein